VKRSRLKKLYQAMHEILHEAIAHEGSTLSDGTYRNALNAPGSYQNHHRVYDRHGLLCNRCKREKITRIVQAQRSTFYCSQCQPYSPTPGSPNGRSNHTKEDGGS
jgi:formamidopyrimidine-DNA glycosylase